MSDLTLEDTVFESLKKTFSSISDRMEDARRSLRGADASAVGESKLVEDVQDFADEWGYGIKQLGKHTHGASSMEPWASVYRLMSALLQPVSFADPIAALPRESV
ncbi:hypothetical protein ACOZDF_05915 [Streptomyces griseoincarnatus]